MKDKIPYILTIAGSDASGGAGIQADIKTITTCNGYAASAITCVTAQNSKGVFDIVPIPIKSVKQQIVRVLEDLPIKVIKIGMLYSQEIIIEVANILKQYPDIPVVLDPIMIASSNKTLLQEKAFKALENDLINKVTLLTPNIPEANILLRREISDPLKDVVVLGQRYKISVLLKGGHQSKDGYMKDILYDYPNNKTYTFIHPAIKTTNTHGTGCTLSSAIATYLGKKQNLYSAVKDGIDYLQSLLQKSKDRSNHKENGPLFHFLNIE